MIFSAGNVNYPVLQQQSNKDAGRGRASHDVLCLPGMNAEVPRAIQDERTSDLLFAKRRANFHCP
jgi:hypothetical protein